MRLTIKWIDGWASIHGTGPDGKRIRKSLKTRDPVRAAEACAQLEARLWRAGLYGASEVTTFDECALAYAEDGGDTRYLLKVSEALAGRRLKDITPNDIRAMARKLYPAAKASTVNRQAITPARAVINYGHAQGWCGAIKVKGMDMPKVKRRAVTRAYVEGLRPHLPHRLYCVMLFLHTTGRRVEEALAIQPADVDLQGKTIHIPDTKNGEPATAYLTDEMADLLRGIMPDAGTVFGYVGRSSLYPTLRRACAKAGLPYLGTHQVGRHSYATTLHNAGWGSKAIADAGGWKSVRLVAETYEHPEDAGKRAAKLIGRKLASGKSATKAMS